MRPCTVYGSRCHKTKLNQPLQYLSHLFLWKLSLSLVASHHGRAPGASDSRLRATSDRKWPLVGSPQRSTEGCCLAYDRLRTLLCQRSIIHQHSAYIVPLADLLYTTTHHTSQPCQTIPSPSPSRVSILSSLRAGFAGLVWSMSARHEESAK